MAKARILLISDPLVLPIDILVGLETRSKQLFFECNATRLIYPEISSGKSRLNISTGLNSCKNVNSTCYTVISSSSQSNPISESILFVSILVSMEADEQEHTVPKCYMLHSLTMGTEWIGGKTAVSISATHFTPDETSRYINRVYYNAH